MSNKLFTFPEYLNEFTLHRRAREFWKLFKIRGSLDNRHLCFNICHDCANILFNDKEKLKFETDKESNLASILISFRLCEDCVERNVFETNSYIFKYGHKRRNQPNTVSIENKADFNKEDQPILSDHILKKKILKKSKE